MLGTFVQFLHHFWLDTLLEKSHSSKGICTEQQSTIFRSANLKHVFLADKLIREYFLWTQWSILQPPPSLSGVYLLNTLHESHLCLQVYGGLAWVRRSKPGNLCSVFAYLRQYSHAISLTSEFYDALIVQA